MSRAKRARSQETEETGESKNSLEATFSAATTSSIFAQERRAGSSREQGRGKAEAQLRLTQTHAYQNDLVHAMAKYMQHEIELKAAEMQRLIEARRAFIADAKTQSDMSTDLHLRLLSKREQRNANKVHSDWVANENRKRTKSEKRYGTSRDPPEEGRGATRA